MADRPSAEGYYSGLSRGGTPRQADQLPAMRREWLVNQGLTPGFIGLPP